MFINIHWKNIASDLGNIGFSAACVSGAIAGYSLYTHEKIDNPDVFVKIYLVCKLLKKGVSDFQNKNIYTGRENQQMINIARTISSFVITNAIAALFSIQFFNSNSAESLKEAFITHFTGFVLFNAAVEIPQFLISWTGCKIIAFASSYFPKSKEDAPPRT